MAPVALGATARVQWGDGHRALARVNAEWLAEVIDGLEACPDLLERVDVVFTNLAVRRGGRLELPHGPNRVTIRQTRAVDAVREVAATPVRFCVLIDKLLDVFPAVDLKTVRGMLTGLVRQGFLITALRAPYTITDPLAHLVNRLREADVDALPVPALRLRELSAVHENVGRHNVQAATWAEQAHARAALARRMTALSQAGRTPLAVDVRLDCDMRLPCHVVDEMARAAGALLRLTRQPAAEAAWRDFHTAFCERYGTGTLVPLTDVVDPDAGLGYPAGYPGSVLSLPTDRPSERDQRMLSLAWQAVVDGNREVTVTDERIRALVDVDRFDEHAIPPHVELAGRIHAASPEALDRGDYTIMVFPGRSGGTLTSRFTAVANGSGLEDAYRALPASAEGALPAQLSFAPIYPHAENICRVPAYLSHLLPLGEHRHPADGTVLTVDDLAITATRDRLHLVSVSRRRVVEPQVFHALALDKQPPPLARFLAQLPRAFGPGWLLFDWGPQAQRLPYLPRVRYRRCVLSLARWQIPSADLPAAHVARDEWRRAFARWRARWQCPAVVDLRDADRTLRLTLDEPAHAALLRAHLDQHDDALLTEAPTAADFGWLNGHAHEIAVPLVTTRAPTPSPLRGALPEATNSGHGQFPGSPQAAWLSAKIHTHPERLTEIVAEHVPALLASLDDEPSYWFVRYRSQHETDHIRLRILTQSPRRHAAYMQAVGQWARHLQRAGLVGRLVFDTYNPEIGRYGHGPAIDAAEAVFAADSQAVAIGLRRLPETAVDPTVLAVASMVHIVSGFFGARADAMHWLAARPAPTAPATDRALADEAIRLAGRATPDDVTGWRDELDAAWQARTAALDTYRQRLPPEADLDGVVESLLHMHHNRAIGIDPESERACRRLARQAALAWRAQRGSHR